MKKTIHNYRERIKFLVQQTGTTERKVKELIKRSLETGFTRLDWSGKHLDISSKHFQCTYFGHKIFDESMPGWRPQFITIEQNEVIPLNQLKTLAIQCKQDQKSYACVDSQVNIEKKLHRKTKLIPLLNNLKESFLLNLAKCNLNNHIYLREIAQLFGFADNSGASRLLQRLEKENLLSVKERLQLIPQQNGEQQIIDSRFMKKTIYRNGNLYYQHANDLRFSLPFQYKQHAFVIFNNECNDVLERNRSDAKEKEYSKLHTFLQRKTWRVWEWNGVEKVKEVFLDQIGQYCGRFLYTSVGYLDETTGRKKLAKTKKDLLIKKTFVNGTCEKYTWDSSVNEWVFRKSVEITKSMLGGFDFMIGRKKLIVNDDTHRIILNMMDVIAPVIPRMKRKGSKI